MGRVAAEEPVWPPEYGLLGPNRPNATGNADDWRAWAERLEQDGADLHAELLSVRRDLAHVRAKATRSKKQPAGPAPAGLLSPELWPEAKPRGRQPGSVHDKDVERALVLLVEGKVAGRTVRQAQAINAARAERGARALRGTGLRAAVNLLSKAMRAHRNSGR